MPEATITTEVDGRVLQLSKLDKVLFPAVHLTKADVIAYYTDVADVLLAHLAGKIVTRVRFPDGIDGRQQFFEKNPPPGAPEWLPRQRVVGDETTDYVLIGGVAELVYLANLASLELHVPQWRVADASLDDGVVLLDDEHQPRVRSIVVDLDPGPGITMVESAHAALIMANLIAADGLEPLVKTSGSKGLQVYAGVAPTPAPDAEAYVRNLAERAAAAHPDKFVLVNTKAKRSGRIFIDVLQNRAARTTVAPYSLRARERATCSTPVTWDEVGAVAAPDALRFDTADVRRRLDAHGDLFAGLLTADHPPLPHVG